MLHMGNCYPANHYLDHMTDAGKVMVWVGLTENSDVLEPRFLNGNLDTREYLQITRYNVVQRDFRNLGNSFNNIWWQQDGAPSYTNSATINYLRGSFPGKAISKWGDFPWPPRSPDLTVMNFFLWSHLKQKIWDVPQNQQPTDLNQFRNTIITESRAFQQATVIDSFKAVRD